MIAEIKKKMNQQIVRNRRQKKMDLYIKKVNLYRFGQNIAYASCMWLIVGCNNILHMYFCKKYHLRLPTLR